MSLPLPEFPLFSGTFPVYKIQKNRWKKGSFCRAGARNETSENLGAAHVVRVAAGLSTRNQSQFAITRNIQQVGANLTATSDRETISYTLEGTRQAVEQALPFLAEVATQQVFKPWEVAELGDRLKLEIAVRPLQVCSYN